METIELKQDLEVYFLQAKSFPQGIAEAHESLHKIIPSNGTRNYFGISRPENGSIIYRAAAEKLPGEINLFPLETLKLKSGHYLCLSIHNYQNKISDIEKTFQELLKHRHIDPEGYCVEWYFNKLNDMRCMVRLVEQKR